MASDASGLGHGVSSRCLRLNCSDWLLWVTLQQHPADLSQAACLRRAAMGNVGPPGRLGLIAACLVGRMIALDLYAEVKSLCINSDQLYGVPYIWCMLHNFAADFEMYGLLML